MKSRVRQLEEQLALATPTAHEAPSLTLNNSFVGTFHVQRRGMIPGVGEVSAQSVTHKGRVFGQSHWLNCFIPVRQSLRPSQSMSLTLIAPGYV